MTAPVVCSIMLALAPAALFTSRRIIRCAARRTSSRDPHDKVLSSIPTPTCYLPSTPKRSGRKTASRSRISRSSIVAHQHTGTGRCRRAGSAHPRGRRGAQGGGREAGGDPFFVKEHPDRLRAAR